MSFRNAFHALHERRLDAVQSLRTGICGHKQTEVRAMAIRGGTKQYVHQCTHCGDRVGVALSQMKWHQEHGRSEPPAFDEELRKNHSDERSNYSFEAVKADHNREWWDLYNVYLRSEEWSEKRTAVMTRENGICQGCSSRRANQVHHLSYDHVGDELLFELVALCHECHEKAHHSKAA